MSFLKCTKCKKLYWVDKPVLNRLWEAEPKVINLEWGLQRLSIITNCCSLPNIAWTWPDLPEEKTATDISAEVVTFLALSGAKYRVEATSK